MHGMVTDAGVKCKMCDKRDMVPAKGKGGVDLDLLLCPNCDDPNGKTPPFNLT